MTTYNLNEFLRRNLGDSYTLFYVIEPNDKLFNKKSDPHHIHYMISLDDSLDIDTWIKKIDLHFLLYDVVYDSTSWIKEYNPELGYIKYCAAKINSRKDNYFLFRESDIHPEK